MPPKKKAAKKKRVVRRVVVVQNGAGFFDDVGGFFTNTIPSAARATGNWVNGAAGTVKGGINEAARWTGQAALAAPSYVRKGRDWVKDNTGMLPSQLVGYVPDPRAKGLATAMGIIGLGRMQQGGGNDYMGAKFTTDLDQLGAGRRRR